jgi:hypothetical protein
MVRAEAIDLRLWMAGACGDEIEGLSSQFQLIRQFRLDSGEGRPTIVAATYARLIRDEADGVSTRTRHPDQRRRAWYQANICWTPKIFDLLDQNAVTIKEKAGSFTPRIALLKPEDLIHGILRAAEPRNRLGAIG